VGVHMNRFFGVAITVVTLSLVVGLGSASAQPDAQVNIGFAFLAGGRAMPAGTYTVQVPASGPITLRAADGKAMMLPVITRLGRHDRDAEPELVFDRIQGELRLSEVWLPGQDGYLLLGTKEMHDHTVVGGPLGKK
jgi:hypothetical protein